MSLAMDAILIVIAASIIISCWKKGLIRAVMGILTSIASLIAAYAYTPVLAPYIRDRYLLERITANIGETLKGWALDTTTDLYNLDRFVSTPNDEFSSILDRYGVALNSIADKLRGLINVGENEVDSLAEDIASPTSNLLANVIAFALIFAAAFLVLSLLTALIDKIFKLPVLSGANRFFGFLFGVAEAVIVTSIAALALSVLVTGLGAISPDLFGQATVENTIVCRFLTEHNVFSFLSGLFTA